MYGKYDFAGDGLVSDVSVKLGINNVADTSPPLADSGYGYSSAVYQAYPRYFYLNISKSF